MFSFEDLSPQVRKALKDMGYSEPTPIQKKSIPMILSGEDLVGQAQTGTGKTAAFGIPIAEKLRKGAGLRAVILTPTRELALQVRDELAKISKYKGVRVFAVYGGTPLGKQIQELKRLKPEVVVGTPGRIKDLLNRGVLNFNKVEIFVLDEADQMLDMGFIEDIEFILSQTPAERQTLLFSATIPSQVLDIVRRHVRPNYRFVKVGNSVEAPKIHQHVVFVDRKNRFSALLSILRRFDDETCIVFVKTKKGAAELENLLKKSGIDALAIHGDLSQRRREYVLESFRRGRIRVLVATDVAARGIDVKKVGLVVNYELPENPELYVHRIGRTGRAGREGRAISLVAEGEKRLLYRIKPLRKSKVMKVEPASIEQDIERWARKNSVSKEALKLLEKFPPEVIVSYFVSHML